MRVGALLRCSDSTTKRRETVTRFVSGRDEAGFRGSTPRGTSLHDDTPLLHVRSAVHGLEAAQQQRGIAHGHQPRREEGREELPVVGAAIRPIAKARHRVQLRAVHHRVHAKVAGNALTLLRPVGAAALFTKHVDAYAHRRIVASAAREGNARRRVWITGYFGGTASAEGQEVSPMRLRSISKIRSAGRSAAMRSPTSRRVPSRMVAV